MKMYEFWLWLPKFVPKGRFNNISALIQIMAWCLPGNKPLPEPLVVSLLMHICVARSQSVKHFTHLHWCVSTQLLISPNNSFQWFCTLLYNLLLLYHIVLKPHSSHVSSAIKIALFQHFRQAQIESTIAALYLEFHRIFKFLCNR